MAEKNGFLLYSTQRGTIKLLSTTEKAELLDIIYRYNLYGTASDGSIFDDEGYKVVMSPKVELVFSMIKTQFDMDKIKYERIREVRAEIGKMGGLAKASKSYQKLPKASKPTVNVNDNVNVNGNDNDNVNENKKNIPPDFSEIADYCKSRGNDVDPEKRYNFYASKGRMVGKNKMVDWRAAVRTREKKKDIDEIFQEYKKSQEDITPETKPIVWKSFIDKYGKDKMQKVLDKVNEGIGTFITNL